MRTRILTLDDLRLRSDQRGAIIGSSGCGKTELARALIPRTGRVAIIDPKRMFKFKVPDPSFKIIDDPLKIYSWRCPERFIYRPKEQYVHNMAAYNLVYKQIYRRGKGFVYTDDPVGIVHATKFPPYLQMIYQLGREKKIAALTSFQRPSWVPGFLMSESRKFYVFDFPYPADQKKVAEMVRGYSEDLVKEPYTFAFYETRNPRFREAVSVKLDL